jgi:hypothetical protein
MVRLTSTGRVFQLSGPELRMSSKLSKRCDVMATTNPAFTKARAKSICVQGEPPVPCESTTSRPLPGSVVAAGVAPRAALSANGPMRNACSGVALG